MSYTWGPDQPDYVTIVPASKVLRYNVVVMRYRATSDEYYPLKVSAMLTQPAAEEIAQLWATERGVTIR